MTILGKELRRVPIVFDKECGYIPSILVSAEKYLEKHFHTPDLFQIQGCANKVPGILSQLSSPSGLSGLRVSLCVHDVVEAVKTFLIRLPEPLLGDAVCDSLIEASQADNNLDAILVQLRLTQPRHFSVLHFMMRLLARVAAPDNGNNMDVRKLATIFVLDVLKPLRMEDTGQQIPMSFPSDRLQRLPYLIMVLEHFIKNLHLFNNIQSDTPHPLPLHPPLHPPRSSSAPCAPASRPPAGGQHQQQHHPSTVTSSDLPASPQANNLLNRTPPANVATSSGSRLAARPPSSYTAVHPTTTTTSTKPPSTVSCPPTPQPSGRNNFPSTPRPATPADVYACPPTPTRPKPPAYSHHTATPSPERTNSRPPTPPSKPTNIFSFPQLPPPKANSCPPIPPPEAANYCPPCPPPTPSPQVACRFPTTVTPPLVSCPPSPQFSTPPLPQAPTDHPQPQQSPPPYTMTNGLPPRLASASARGSATSVQQQLLPSPLHSSLSSPAGVNVDSLARAICTSPTFSPLLPRISQSTNSSVDNRPLRELLDILMAAGEDKRSSCMSSAESPGCRSAASDSVLNFSEGGGGAGGGGCASPDTIACCRRLFSPPPRDSRDQTCSPIARDLECSPVTRDQACTPLHKPVMKDGCCNTSIIAHSDILGNGDEKAQNDDKKYVLNRSIASRFKAEATFKARHERFKKIPTPTPQQSFTTPKIGRRPTKANVQVKTRARSTTTKRKIQTTKRASSESRMPLSARQRKQTPIKAGKGKKSSKTPRTNTKGRTKPGDAFMTDEDLTPWKQNGPHSQTNLPDMSILDKTIKHPRILAPSGSPEFTRSLEYAMLERIVPPADTDHRRSPENKSIECSQSSDSILDIKPLLKEMERSPSKELADLLSLRINKLQKRVEQALPRYGHMGDWEAERLSPKEGGEYKDVLQKQIDDFQGKIADPRNAAYENSKSENPISGKSKDVESIQHAANKLFASLSEDELKKESPQTSSKAKGRKRDKSPKKSKKSSSKSVPPKNRRAASDIKNTSLQPTSSVKHSLPKYGIQLSSKPSPVRPAASTKAPTKKSRRTSSHKGDSEAHFFDKRRSPSLQAKRTNRKAEGRFTTKNSERSRSSHTEVSKGKKKHQPYAHHEHTQIKNPVPREASPPHRSRSRSPKSQHPADNLHQHYHDNQQQHSLQSLSDIPELPSRSYNVDPFMGEASVLEEEEEDDVLTDFLTGTDDDIQQQQQQQQQRLHDRNEAGGPGVMGRYHQQANPPNSPQQRRRWRHIARDLAWMQLSLFIAVVVAYFCYSVATGMASFSFVEEIVGDVTDYVSDYIHAWIHPLDSYDSFALW